MCKLRTWVITETEFQTISSKTVEGSKKKHVGGASTLSVTGHKSQGTFFGGTKDSRKTLKFSCKICTRQRGVWTWNGFTQTNVSDRWNIAVHFHLCYRCLGIYDHQIEYMRICEYKRPRSLFDFWPGTLIVWQFQTSESHWASCDKISYKASRDWGN